jgi:hypothetical protein
VLEEESGDRPPEADWEAGNIVIDDYWQDPSRVALKRYFDHELSKRMRAAIMFRLCTKMCNHSTTSEEEERDISPGPGGTR